MRTLIVSALLIFFTGCNTFQLDEKWEPLVEMVERPALKNGDGITTTVGTRIYRADIDSYLEKNPPGSAQFDSLLYHEQIHSKRQLHTGLAVWLSRYGTDTAFMWKEEQLGYYAQIINLRKRGLTINIEGIARALSGYKNFRGAMVSYEDAIVWVRDVVGGRWKPAEEDMWSLPSWLQ